MNNLRHMLSCLTITALCCLGVPGLAQCNPPPAPVTMQPACPAMTPTPVMPTCPPQSACPAMPRMTYTCPQGQACPSAPVAARENMIENVPVGEVVIGEMVVMRLRAAMGGYSPVARATIAAQRICAQLDQGRCWSDIRVSCPGAPQAAVYMGDALIVMIQPQDAMLNNTTPDGLASTWAQRTQIALQTSVCPRVAGSEEPLLPEPTPCLPVPQGTPVPTVPFGMLPVGSCPRA